MGVKRHRTHFDVTAQDGTKGAFDSVERNLQRTQNAASRMGQTFRAVLGATVFAGLTREAGQAAMEAEKAQTRLNAVLRATGGAAGVTRREIDQLADSLADNSLLDDEAFRAGAAELVKFGNIHGNVFRDAMALSADLASFMGTDVPAAAQVIGRSLQSPTEGLRMMEREFGKLTEAEESHINTLVEQGRALEAQQAVLELYRRKVGGVAQEMNTGLTGAWTGAKKAANELLETLGANGTRLNRTFGGATQLMKDLKGELEGARTPLRGLMEDSLAWLGYLRHVPGVIGQIGLAAHRASEQARLTVSGRIKGTTTLAEAQQQQSEFEASLAAGQTGISLGGKTTDAAAAKREAEFLAQKAQELEDMAAQDRLEASEALTKVEIDNEKRRQGELKRTIEAQVESAQVATELAQDLIYTWDAAGNRIELTAEAFESMLDVERRAKEAAHDLGLTFSSAFEDWIVDIERASDGLKALEKDVIRIIARKAITEPLAGGISGVIDKVLKGGLGGVFGGGGADTGGGGVSAEEMAALGIPFFAKGTDFVQNDGLAYLHRGEVVVPAGENRGGPAFHFHNHVDARADADQVFAAIDRANRATEARILRSFKSGGVFAQAAGNA